MSLPQYAKYKDSGLAWLGDVPAHWLIAPVKRLGKLKGGAGFPHVEQGHETEELPFHKVNALGRAGNDGVLWGSENNISRATAERLGAYIFPSGTLVFAKVGAALLLGRIRRLGEAACIDNNMMGLVVDAHDVDVAFVSHALNLVRFDLIANPGAVPSLNEGQIGNFLLVLPNRAEQSTIATFLDRETGKIDALIAEQEKLLTLLAEKRQATISHAVTRGLNPNAPIKDSGVPWLGEVPAHWEVKRIKDVARLESGHTPSKQVPEYWENCDIPWVSLNDSKQLALVDYISETAVQINAAGLENSSARMLPPGTVVFTRDATIGLAAITTKAMAVSQHLIAWCPSPLIDCVFLLRVFNFLKPHLESLAFGATIKTIGMGEVKRLVTPLPPPEEQQEIAQYISAEIGKIDKLRHCAQRAVELLKERRSALVAAAVTGKIDVRNAA